MNKHLMKRCLIIIIPHGVCLDLRTYFKHSCTILSIYSLKQGEKDSSQSFDFFFLQSFQLRITTSTFCSQFFVEMQQNCSFKEPACVQSRTATPVNLLLGGGQEVEGINTIESTQSMRGRED